MGAYPANLNETPMDIQDLPLTQTGVSPSALRMLSPDELSQYTAPQRKYLQNMLGERLRRQPPPTPEEILGIRELASQWGATHRLHG